MGTEILNVKIPKFYERNLIEESMYWEVRVNISNFWNNVLHEILEVDPVIILIILFCCWKILLLSTETLNGPQASKWKVAILVEKDENESPNLSENKFQNTSNIPWNTSEYYSGDCTDIFSSEQDNVTLDNNFPASCLIPSTLHFQFPSRCHFHS